MYRRVAQRPTLRTAIAFTICIALLPIPGISLLISGVAQDQREERKGKPKPGKPEGVLPNLEDIKQESGIEREAPPPVPSTVRSPKSPLQPWNGRRVGDPGTRVDLGQSGGRNELVAEGSVKLSTRQRENRTKRAHATKSAAGPPPVPDDQFVQNFFNWSVGRAPFGNESTFWNDQFRVAYGQGQTSVMLAGVALGKTLFESAEYAARTRDNHWYVYDLYKTFLMRDPDPSGWAYWESVVPANGRENVRRAFEVSPEFAGIMAGIVPNGAATANAASLISALVEPRHQPGNGMLTRDVNWRVPLLSLPGRAGLDLGLALSYSSMVWTRSGPYLHFDEDNGFPSPGFRLGFPTVQRKVFDAQTAKNAFLLITPAGRRVELRQVGSSSIYEAADSSYLQLTDNSSYLVVRSTDGTQLSFAEINHEFSCTQVKDRNGNYITINHNYLGRISTITDTLGRVITFNYDGNMNLLSITQAWNGQPSHQWVSFGWGTRTMQSSFSDSTLRGIIGPANNTVLPVLTQVNLNDTSYFTFDYTNSLQVSAIRNYFEVERNATTFTYETPAGDAPRLLDSRVSANNWTGVNGVPSQVITSYSVAGDGACVLTTPDGTIYKEYYGTGWQKGLTTLSEVWAGGVRQKWTTTSWTQDNTAVGYEMNPRVTETNVYDASGNRRRTTVSYYPTTWFSLPSDVYEYAVDATTVLRRTHTDYNLSATYTDRRMIGLPSGKYIFDGNNTLQQLDVFDYDYGGGFLTDTPQTPTQHDTSYGVGFLARGNLSIIRHTDVINPGNPVHDTLFVYNKTGSVTSVIDPLGHATSFSYTDSFSDAVDRHTFAYPSATTDADGFSSYLQYNFDFGATTRTQSPAPAGQSQGAIQTMTYNNLGQLERITTANNGAYTRYIYGSYYVQSFATVNNVADEAYSCQVFDGLGRVTGSAANHPGSTGGYRAQNTSYDLMGRTDQTSNPTEITGTWVPVGDDAAGWLYTEQTYDWQGRPLRTTHPDPDTTYREASYSGCGCAGGEVVTLTDEGTIDGGIAKRRQQKIYSDVLGRTVKTEILNWQGGSVYSATVNTYNARDQVTQVRQYAGPEGSGTYQDTITTYDGYGRMKTRHVPQQNVGTATTWVYNADDTIHSVTDARGATATFTYNNARHLPNIVTHTFSGSSTIVRSFGYDAAGNRTSMTDDQGLTTYHYDQLSRMDWEERTFSGVPGVHRLTYSYNLAGQVQSMTDPAGLVFSYSHDTAGRVTKVANALSGETTTYAKDLKYRAWGVLKELTHGGNNFKTTLTYNQRLQLQQYRVVKSPQQGSTVVIHNDYGYYDDGVLKSAADGNDNKFDRSYRYDQVGRLSQAFTGALAISQFADSGTGPYYQTYQHDVWGNLTARSGRYWSQGENFSASYTNNRRQGSSWIYDAEGNAIQDADAIYSYDAVGHNRAMTSANGQRTTTQWHDGNGQAVRVERRRTVPSLSVTNSYYLRSSVLGGRVVTEFNSAGQKTIGRVYLGDLVLGIQDGTNAGIVARHENPITGNDAISFAHGTFFNKTQEDPMGINVGLTDPFEEQVEFEPDLMLAKVIVNRSGECICPRCFADGIEIDCRIAGMMVEGGAAARCPNDDCGPRTIYNSERRRHELSPVTWQNGRLGWFEYEYEYQQINKDYEGIAEDGSQLAGFATDFVRVFRSVSVVGGLFGAGLNPQQSPTIKIPLLNQKKLLQHTLAYADCAKFMSQLISKTADLVKVKNAPVSTDIMTLYAMVNRQSRGGFRLNHDSGPLYGYEFKGYEMLEPVAGGGGATWGVWGSSNMTVWINEQELPATARPKDIARVPFVYATRLLHELVHAAGTNRTYEETDMEAAAAALEPGLTLTGAIRKHCIPRAMW